jgi:hypothetical protein
MSLYIVFNIELGMPEATFSTYREAEAFVRANNLEEVTYISEV